MGGEGTREISSRGLRQIGQGQGRERGHTPFWGGRSRLELRLGLERSMAPAGSCRRSRGDDLM